MSDIGTTSGAENGNVAAAPTSAPPPATLAPTSVPTSAPGDLFAEPPADQAVFDRGYVERIRREGQRYRQEQQALAERAGKYDQVFGGYDEADQQVWCNLARTWSTNPAEAAAIMQNIAQAVLADSTGTADASHAATASADDGEGSLDELTPERVQQMIGDALTQQQRAQLEQQAVQEVYAEVRAAGYEPGSPEAFMVLWYANNEGSGDVKVGVEKMRAYNQKVIDDYVTGRVNGAHPTPSPANGVVASEQAPIHDLRDARKAAEAFIRGQVGASSG
jgi:hypothetical protein